MKKIFFAIATILMVVQGPAFGMDVGQFKRQGDLAVNDARQNIFYGIKQCNKQMFDFGWPTYSNYLSNRYLFKPSGQPSVKQVSSTTASTSHNEDVNLYSIMSDVSTSNNIDKRKKVVHETIVEKTSQENAREELCAIEDLVNEKWSKAPVYTPGCYKFRQGLKGLGHGIFSLCGFGVLAWSIKSLVNDGDKFFGACGMGFGAFWAGYGSWHFGKNVRNFRDAEIIVTRRQKEIGEIKGIVDKFKLTLVVLNGKSEKE